MSVNTPRGVSSNGNLDESDAGGDSRVRSIRSSTINMSPTTSFILQAKSKEICENSANFRTIGGRAARSRVVDLRESRKNLPSVTEVILSRGRLNNKYAMPEYDIPAYDGKMYNFKNQAEPVSEWRKDKGVHFFEELAKKKNALPPPDKYDNMPKEAVCAPTLYKFDNKTYADNLIASAS